MAVGNEFYGRLCTGDPYPDVFYNPQETTINPENLYNISIGQHHTLITMNDGSVLACGRAKEGQLNINPDNEMALTPVNISAPGRGIRFVAATTLGTIIASDR